jgi:hypothetical protein
MILSNAFPRKAQLLHEVTPLYTLFAKNMGRFRSLLILSGVSTWGILLRGSYSRRGRGHKFEYLIFL